MSTDDQIKMDALEKSLKWFVDRDFVILSKFKLYGPEDTTEAMKVAYVNAKDALAMVRS